MTCASTSGYQHAFDNRYLWMNVKRIIGSHFVNYREAWLANRLVLRGRIHPKLSLTYPLEHIGHGVDDVYRNRHHGKVGVLCLAPAEGLGVDAPELRPPTRRLQPLPVRTERQKRQEEEDTL